MRHVLVTGGAGYIGSHVVIDLLASGHRPVVIDNLSTGHKDLIPEGVPLYRADIADRHTVFDVLRTYSISDVVHCAASLRVDESMRDPVKYWQNNVGGSVALVNACAAAQVRRFVFSSTAAVYGEGHDRPVTEEDATRPVSPYGTTKRAVEVMLRDICRASGMNSVALRYFNVAGADPFGRSGPAPSAEPSLIRKACQAALGVCDGISIFGTDYGTSDGTAVRDYIHVSDLARIHTLMLARLDGEAAGSALVVNCGYGSGVTVRQVVEATLRLTGTDFPVREAPRRAGDIESMVADTRLLRERFRWRPDHAALDRMIVDCINWERRLLQGEVCAPARVMMAG